MPVEEVEKAENSDDLDRNDTGKPEKVEELKVSDKNSNSSGKDLNIDAVVDVSGKSLDFPVLEAGKNAIEGLYVYKNEFNLIPRAVGALRKLRTLKFFSNEVNLFPREFGNLIELECLQVKVAASGMSELDLGKLRNLKELELSRVPPRPSAFPIFSQIAGLKRLTRLSVCYFSIRYLPPEIGCLTNLEYLDLSFNKMRHLPDEITSLSSLISLKVANNKLVELPSALSSLQRLENLDLSNNRLTSLQCLELGSMYNLQRLNLQHNRLLNCDPIPSWIWCNLDGNGVDSYNDEYAEMDVYEGGLQESRNGPHYGSLGTSLSQPSGLLSNNRRLAARKGKVWKRQRLNNNRKWKNSEKCMTCRVSPLNGDSLPESSSAITDADTDNKDKISRGDGCGDSLSGVENQDMCSGKESLVNQCACSGLESPAMHKAGEGGCSESGASVDCLSDADGSSALEKSCSSPKSKRHSEKDLDYPKPTKYRKPTNDPSLLSRQYSKLSFCGVDDYLPDGFYDAGRDRPFMPLKSYEQNAHLDAREVILVDRERDEGLDAILLCARALIYHFKQINGTNSEDENVAIDNLQVASLLALFVSDHFGGSDKSAVLQKTRKAVSGSNYRKPFVCTCATGDGDCVSKATEQSLESMEDTVFRNICEKSIRSIKASRNSIIVPIGGLQFGVCRHRALLMKYLCDRMKPRVPCEVVRGYLDFSPHAWNVIVAKKGKSWIRWIVDACHPHDIREESDPEYICRYVPLSRTNAPVAADGDPSPNCSFPSLSGCDEDRKTSSTTLMQCNIGSLPAAAKVRALQVSGASADEIRSFEFNCLAEVRLLSTLKHSCIVEFYGHQISLKWSPSAESGGRTLQSVILMEYIKGGNLKNYLEKLSGAGEKRVPLDLALFLARDVAFSLRELHYRHIIHRDIKSENILIDLDEKRPDGTPIVKVCDFDRAIPLRACLHTCCIRHAGVPPPDICVGTPRWMAPEVLRAMHKPNMYGLEVDIWSFGCLLLELLTLKVPYSELPESEIHNSLQMGDRPKLTKELDSLAQSEKELDTETEILRFLVNLYYRCTEKNPTDRPTAEDLHESLLARADSVLHSRSSEKE